MKANPVYLRKTVCPHCGIVNPLHTSMAGEGEPEAGDRAMCISCGAWAIFAPADNNALVLRKCTKAEAAELEKDATCMTAERAWRLATRRMRGGVT